MRVLCLRVETVAVAVAILLSCSPARGAEENGISQESLPVMALEVTPLDSFPACAGSRLSNMSKVEATLTAPGIRSKYKTFYCSNGKVIGCNRHSNLTLQRGDEAHVRVVLPIAQAGDAELNAAAGSVCRIVLDLLVNSNSATTVYVPNESFDQFCTAMSRRHFTADSFNEVTAPIALQVRSYGSQRSTVLYYASSN